MTNPTDIAGRPGHAPDGDERSDLQDALLALAGTLDLDLLLDRLVAEAGERLDADRVWILRLSADHPEQVERLREHRRGTCPDEGADARLSLEAIGEMLERARSSDGVVELPPSSGAEQRGIRGRLVRKLPTAGPSEWFLDAHICREGRQWAGAEIETFRRLTEVAGTALTNAEEHRKALLSAASLEAILDQLPYPAMVFNQKGELLRANPAAEREPMTIARSAAERTSALQPKGPDGSSMDESNLPAVRALRGESVREDIHLRDPQTGQARVWSVNAGPIRDERDEVVGSVAITRDVTEERAVSRREELRRSRAECIAGLGLDLLAESLDLNDLDEIARTIGETIGGNAFIYLYRREEDEIHLAGGYSPMPRWPEFRDYLRAHPYAADEGLPGTVMHLGRPLLFSELRGEAIVDFTREEKERELKESLDEQSLLAYPIELNDNPVGTLILSLSTDTRAISSDDLDFAHDISERLSAANRIRELSATSNEGLKAAEELARREVSARARLEAVLDSAPIGIAVISADELRFEVINERWVEFVSLFGPIGPQMTLLDYHVSDFLPGFESDLQEVAEQGVIRTDEAMEMYIGGDIRYFNRIISPVQGRFSGSTQNLTVLIQEVTDQVRAKREIEALAQLMEERSARLDSILSSMSDALWVYDSLGDVIDVNRAALTMFGIGSRREAVIAGSRDGLDLRYSDARPIPSEEHPLTRALQGETIPDLIAVGRHTITDRNLDLSIAAAPIRSGGEVSGAVIVMRDITALLELDRKKDEFLSVASHELRTPLTTIKGYTQLLRHAHDSLESKERDGYLDSVLSEIERMMGLISELLDVSRIDTKRLQIQPNTTGWLAFLQARVSAFQMQYPDRAISLRSEIEERDVEVDPQRMRQVIDNLLSNAFKYSPDGSPVELVVREREGQMETSVVDHGIGIPPEEISRLFERFHRASNVSSRYYGGLGLGLYISRAIVEAHGGTLDAASDESDGSTFTVIFPERQD